LAGGWNRPRHCRFNRGAQRQNAARGVYASAQGKRPQGCEDDGRRDDGGGQARCQRRDCAIGVGDSRKRGERPGRGSRNATGASTISAEAPAGVLFRTEDTSDSESLLLRGVQVNQSGCPAAYCLLLDCLYSLKFTQGSGLVV